ncbi:MULTISPECIES: sugar-binding transcriptional regulator [unclassified Paenibacillus]|uniref:sugar-binding transcriptional regulator n=1 Tax=unclassified Paenibacillus TaxID=185978 RepID=UPI002F42B2EE
MGQQEERIRLLVKISTLYYLDGMNQQEISNRLGVSRPQVSRLLAEAKTEGIVQIDIHNPFSEEQQYERAISETFGIQDVIVVQSTGDDQGKEDVLLARAAATLLESVIRDNDTVAIMAGRSIASAGARLRYNNTKGTSFVPMIGGFGSDGSSMHANTNTRIMAENMKGSYSLLNAPAIVVSSEAREHFLAERDIANVLEKARTADVAIVGIGQVTKESAIVQSGYLQSSEVEAIHKQGAVSQIGASFLKADGEHLENELESRIIGLSIGDIKKIANVIAIAGGKHKVEAIAAALRGKCMNVLITDLVTAKLVLEWNRLNPVSS